MPRYFFHLRDDMSVDDYEGTDLPDLDAARASAVKQARNLIGISAEEGKINLDHRIEVSAETNAILVTVRFGDVVRIEGRDISPA
jgi:hypothetical protein